MGTFDTILHPTDFSEDSEQAFLLACSLARDQFASLVVVHVLPPEVCPECDSKAYLINEDEPLIRNYREQFRRMSAVAGDIPVSFRIVFGYTVGAVLNVAREENADLIVIASHQHSRFHLQLHGSVAEGLLRQTHCPVMVLRQPTQSTVTRSTTYVTSSKKV